MGNKSFVLFVLLMCLCSTTAFAQWAESPVTLEKKGSKILCIQDGVQSYTPLNQLLDINEYSAYHAARKKIAWGKGVTAVGGLFTVVFGGTTIAFVVKPSNYGGGDDITPVIAAAASTGVAMGVAGVGVALMASGNKKIKKLVNDYNLSATGNGIGLSMRF